MKTMIDTAVLTVPFSNIRITEPWKFNPNADVFLRSSGIGKTTNNPSASERKLAYYPRMTLWRRPLRGMGLRIEFSAPKIVFNNNLDELDNNDFERLINLLQAKIKARGVLIEKNNLIYATVSAFHPSKNIQLLNAYTATLIIRELSKIGLTKKLDLEKTQFRNGGHSLQYYAGSHALVFYDKISDLNKTCGKAIDKDKTALQTELFRSIQEQRKRDFLEVLRMEVRLCKKVKMNQVLNRLGYKCNPVFKDIFSREISRAILMDYWNSIIMEKNAFVFKEESCISDEMRIFLNIKGQKDALALWAIKQFIKERGATELRLIVEEAKGENGWPRAAKMIKEANEILETANDYDYISDIERALKEMVPLRTDKLY